jgi:hypothetical protein
MRVSFATVLDIQLFYIYLTTLLVTETIQHRVTGRQKTVLTNGIINDFFCLYL